MTLLIRASFNKGERNPTIYGKKGCRETRTRSAVSAFLDFYDRPGNPLNQSGLFDPVRLNQIFHGSKHQDHQKGHRWVRLDRRWLTPNCIEVFLELQSGLEVLTSPAVILKLVRTIEEQENWHPSSDTNSWNDEPDDLNAIVSEPIKMENGVGRLTPRSRERAEQGLEKTGGTDARRSNPCAVAIREALSLFVPDLASLHLRVGTIRSSAELETLWAIDHEAYQEASISFDTFRQWWTAFPQGLHVLFFDNEIMGAMGLWPIPNDWAQNLKTGKAREAELPFPEMVKAAEKGATFWYISGIVLQADLIGSRAIKILLTESLRVWLSSPGLIKFPCEILALAYSTQGKALLERFGFYPLQTADEMPDKAPLFGQSLNSLEEFSKLLKARGVEL